MSTRRKHGTRTTRHETPAAAHDAVKSRGHRPTAEQLIGAILESILPPLFESGVAKTL